MAKAPTAAKAAIPTPAPAPAPSQPWAKPSNAAEPAAAPAAPADDAASGNGGGTDAAPAVPQTGGDALETTDSKALVTSTDQIPSTDPAEIPGMDADAVEDVDTGNTHAAAERLAENDVSQTLAGSELPSFVRDQVSPSGIDLALEADRSDKPPLERSAYPSLGERLYQMLGRASPELAQEFEERMVDLAQQVIDQMRKEAQDDILADRLIDGTTHYGPRVAARSDNAGRTGPTNAQLNRRARRAAERVAQASMAAKK